VSNCSFLSQSPSIPHNDFTPNSDAAKSHAPLPHPISMIVFGGKISNKIGKIIFAES